MLNNSGDLVTLIAIQMGAAASALTPEGLGAAADNAISELKWSYPVTKSDQIFWLTKRAIRHACYILWVASAQKFKYKQVNLNQRFDHYEALINHMDAEYDAALSDSSSIFTSVDSYKMFGTAVGAGFRYDGIGRDITYTDLTNFIRTD